MPIKLKLNFKDASNQKIGTFRPYRVVGWGKRERKRYKERQKEAAREGDVSIWSVFFLTYSLRVNVLLICDINSKILRGFDNQSSIRIRRCILK